MFSLNQLNNISDAAISSTFFLFFLIVFSCLSCLLINKPSSVDSSSLNFTTSICPSIAAGAAKAIDIVSLAEQLRIRIKENAALIRENLDSLAIPYLDTNSHIVAVLINDPFLCKKVSKDLIDDHGIYAQPIFYPTVPKGLERLRITVTPKHRKEHIEKMIKALDTVWSKNNLPRKNINKVTANI